MKDPIKFLELLHNQAGFLQSALDRKNEEIREHINRHNLNKPQKWPNDSKRIENIGQNGNDGLHYNV